MKRILIFIISLHFFFNVNSQVAMGKWRTHFAYNAVKKIAQSKNKIYALSEGSLYSIDKEDESIEFYSKMNGLTDANITWVDFDNYSNQLAVFYKNGNIDLLNSAGTINIPDYYNKPLSIDKSVNHVCFTQDRAYLSCNFGILVLNIGKHEVADSYYIGPNGTDIKVLATQVLDGKIYALTPNSIYTANANEPNLVNFEFWSTMQNIPGSGELKKLDILGNKLILFRDNKIFTYTQTEGWKQILVGSDIKGVNSTNTKLVAFATDNSIISVNQNLETKTIINTDEVSDAEFDPETNIYWLAANTKGVKTITEQNTQPKFYKPLGPAVNSPWSMTFAGEKLFVVPGGRWSAQYERKGEIMIFENDKWMNISGDSIKVKTNYNVLDLMNVAVDPKDNKHFFVTSYGTGLYEFRNNKFYSWHNNTNSTLETVISDNPFNYIRLDGATYDNKGNLLVMNMGVKSAVKILSNEGVWKQLSFPDAVKPTFGTILISNQNENQKWVNSVRYTPGIFVFDDNGTPINNDDDVSSKFMSSFNDLDNEGAKISPSTFYCLAQDKNGVIWAGTEQGPLLFYGTSKVFDSDYTCSRVKIPRNDGTGLADYLLQSDKVKSIAIDGANRKWIGTETSGVYLMSENGQETIKHFSTANSPLISDDVMSIVINPVTGEVFFGTATGLVSYQSDAANANDTFNNVHAYPNPVRENYNGIITITGLIKDTEVKITDLSGNLICQTTSNGSIATWNGKNIKGNKVSTGIYLVICANQDGTQSCATKIMVIN